MPAHSNFNDALAGVTAFHDAVNGEGVIRKPSKSKSQKKEKGKKEKKRKEKKESKSKLRDSKRKRKRSKSSDEDSDSSSEEESLEVQLQRGRHAVRLTREMMSHLPEAKTSIRQLFWRLDQGEAVNISSMPNEKLKSLLTGIFTCLKLVNVKEGVFLKRKGGESIVGKLGPILEEQPVQRRQESPPKPAETDSVQAPPSLHNHRPFKDAQEEKAAATNDIEEPNTKGAAVLEEDLGTFDVMPEPKRRVIGPSVPPPELLQQAAEVAEAMEAEDAADMVGPPPPELVLEDDAIPADERSAEVVRILRVIQASKQADRPLNPYDLMDVPKEAPANVVKKRYWKLSLMIHPDKCNHPKADDAFQALSQAAKDLQDVQKRGEVDDALEKAEYKAFEAEQLKKDEIARQWRVAKGEATAEDLKGPLQAGGPQREEWITVLPANRRPKGPTQKSQTSFAQNAVASINQDNSAWGDTPQEKLLRLQQAGTAMLEAAQQDEKTKDKADAVDRYNEAHRSKTLLEKHRDKQKKERKKPKKEDGQSNSKAGWEESHPWRPFDREKDLDVSNRPSNQKEFLAKMGDLSGRFGSSSSQAARKFL